MLRFGLLLLAWGLVAYATDPAIEDEELRARAYLQLLNKKTEEALNLVTIASWNYESNLTDYNLQAKLKAEADYARQEKEDWQETIKFNWQTFSDYDLKRQFKQYSILGTSALPEDKLSRLNRIISDMQKIYATAKVCAYGDPNKCDLSLEPEITQVLANSRNAKELEHIWVEWRKAVGPHCRHMFAEYVDLSNEAARLNNFTNMAEMWLDEFEDHHIRQQAEALWEQLKPLYLQIHAYVRFQLRKKYGDVVSEKGPIPAHLLGNMWSQEWANIADFISPWYSAEEVSLTAELQNQNYTVKKIFETAEDFFKSINMSAMPPLFWERSILEKPKDREMVCHASAWDFHDGKDFRIKQCTEITEVSFVTAHHEMGHIEYYLAYKNQPVKYRGGANSGFHEAVGDLIALSVQSRKHLKKLGLSSSSENDPNSVLKNLFNIGLRKIVFLPFGYLMDLWRWNVFSGNITSDEYNCKWWELREKYQGIEPPVNRTEQDFDPAAKYHMVANVPYIRYFVAFVIQFQFHKAVCEKAGEYDPEDPAKPLYECDIYNSVAAGNALKNMLAMGSSRPWPEALEVLTGKRTMDASGLLEYFKPLHRWLEEENKKNNVHIGWEKSDKVCYNSRN